MRMHKSTVSPKTRPNIDVVFCVFCTFWWIFMVFGCYHGNIINNHKSVVRMRSLDRGIVFSDLGLGWVWVNVGRVYT